MRRNDGVEVTVAIEEGPRTTIRAIGFKGNTVFSESQLRGLVPVGAGYALSCGRRSRGAGRHRRPIPESGVSRRQRS